MSKKQKKKAKAKNPPLSFADKSIYFLAILLSAVLVFLIGMAIYQAKKSIAASNTDVVAYTSGSSILWAFPFLLFVIISLFAFISSNMNNRTPIFGNKKIKYGEYPWSKECFPILDPRRKNVYIKPSKKRFLKTALLIWLSVLLIFSSLVPLCFFERECLMSNNSIVAYGIFNQKISSYTKENLSHLTIEPSEYSTNTRDVISSIFSRKLTIQITIDTSDGNSFTFTYGDFRQINKDGSDALNSMLKVKSLFPDNSITVVGKDRVEKIIESLEFNTYQAQKLRTLFET